MAQRVNALSPSLAPSSIPETDKVEENQLPLSCPLTSESMPQHMPPSGGGEEEEEEEDYNQTD